MSAVLRKALFWLLMLALPLQTSMAVGAMNMPPVSGLPTGMHAMQMSGTGAPSAMAEDRALPQPDCAAPSDCAGVHHAGGNCALTAPCALVAAPMERMAMILPNVLGSIPQTAGLQRRVVFLTDGPERPPRSSSLI